MTLKLLSATTLIFKVNFGEITADFAGLNWESRRAQNQRNISIYIT